MSNLSPKNAVERRMMSIQEDWMTFADDQAARLLYWHIPEEDNELLDTYLQLQEEMASSLITFTQDFVSGEQYTQSLYITLIDYYEARREGAAAQGIIADWQPPKRSDKLGDLDYFFCLTDSLIAHHPDVFPAFVFIFKPLRIGDQQQFALWFKQLLAVSRQQTGLSQTHVRFMLYGQEPAAFEAEFIEAGFIEESSAFRLLKREYYSRNIPREMVAESTDAGPSGAFRRLFVALTETLNHNDPARLEGLRKNALAITSENRWFDQSVVVHLMAGAAYLKWQDFPASIAAYRAAFSDGEQAIADLHPAGNKLVANALFGEASVYLFQKSYPEAARCYERAASYTQVDDPILTVEAWRMSSFCWDSDKQTDRAIEHSFYALEAGFSLEDELRRNSSLPMAATWLYQRLLADQTDEIAEEDESETDYQRMARLLYGLYGETWQDIVAPANDKDDAL